MNGKRARAIRKRIYGDFSLRDRSYTWGDTFVSRARSVLTGLKKLRNSLLADTRRQGYQHAKRATR